MKFFAGLLIAEFLVAGAAPVIFTTIPNRLVAGMIAGTIFIALGLYILSVGLRDRVFRRRSTFWAGCLHLFGSALPLFITRLVHFSQGFDDLTVMGLPGPVFHKLSTLIFSILMISTLIDLVWAWWHRRKSEA